MATGDHLFVQYIWGEHHGIDLGDGTVIEYGGKGTGYMSIRRVSREEFISRGPCFVKDYPAGTTLAPWQTVQLAWTRLREQRYDLFNNNCEHLAHWCKTGRPYSGQIEALKGVLVIGAIVGSIAVLTNPKVAAVLKSVA